MLGSIGRQRPWIWAAIGKHPAATDYIHIGGTSPLIEAVADWAAKGYQHLRPTKERPQAFYSWRFWLQGVKKGEIICGLGRDSSDRIGRPFPLLLIGQGKLKGWEKKWTDLPLLLGKTWQRMELTAAGRFDQLDDMEASLALISVPETSQTAATINGRHCDTTDAAMTQFRNQMISDGLGLVQLNHSDHDDPEASVLQCHRYLETCCTQMPRGVFVGGTPQHTYLAAIEHPLGKADFIRLWSL